MRTTQGLPSSTINQVSFSTMEELLTLRFAKRDPALLDRLTQLKQRMAATGRLHTGTTLKEGYDILTEEYSGSMQTIINTYCDSLHDNNSARPSCIQMTELLQQRRAQLEQIYQTSMQAVEVDLRNDSAHLTYMTLTRAEPLQTRELQLAITKAWGDFQNSQGANLHDPRHE
jgi:hypothetical protein